VIAKQGGLRRDRGQLSRTEAGASGSEVMTMGLLRYYGRLLTELPDDDLRRRLQMYRYGVQLGVIEPPVGAARALRTATNVKP
jgi:hypothetical protein